MSGDREADVFQQLKGILEPFAGQLKVERDEPDDYYLNAGIHPRTGKELFFGAAQIKKNWVSFHLMPVYVYPELLNDVSAELKKRMQGKSCFNFKRPDEALFGELRELTREGFERYEQDGLLP
jgi:hypothetical protein